MSTAGYARWIFLIISLYFMPSNQFLGAAFYILSGFLDAFDGWAARKFNQGSTQLIHYNHGFPLIPNSSHYLCSSIVFPIFINYCFEAGMHNFLHVGTSFGAVLDMTTDR